MAIANSNAARIPVSLSSSWLAARNIVSLGFSPSPQRCSSATAYGFHLRICKFKHPAHLTHCLLFTAAAAAVNSGVSTDAVDNENKTAANNGVSTDTVDNGNQAAVNNGVSTDTVDNGNQAAVNNGVSTDTVDNGNQAAVNNGVSTDTVDNGNQAAVNNGVSTDTVDNDNQAPARPDSSLIFHESISRFRQIISSLSQISSLNFHKSVSRFHQVVINLPPPPAFLIQRQPGADFLLGFFAATVCLFIAVKIYLGRRSSYNDSGTVADLVRRGQLRSDRRGISEPMKYDDPFNNPVVKASKNDSTVEMCGKVYRMAPINLTEEQRSIHQRRRSRAYQWKRPTVFLKEGDAIPPDVDPDTIRWIPANHPFATTSSDIDEGLAQTNVYQKHGVPFRIKAEHEAMQKKLEALQKEEKLGKLYIDSQNAKDFERPFRKQAVSNDIMDQTPENDHLSDVERIGPDRSSDSYSSTKDFQQETEV